MALTAAQQTEIANDLAAVEAKRQAFEKANSVVAAHEETQDENYARAEAVRENGGTLPDGLSITEVVNGQRQVVVKSRGNALRQIKAGVSRFVGGHVRV